MHELSTNLDLITIVYIYKKIIDRSYTFSTKKLTIYKKKLKTLSIFIKIFLFFFF